MKSRTRGAKKRLIPVHPQFAKPFVRAVKTQARCRITTNTVSDQSKIVSSASKQRKKILLLVKSSKTIQGLWAVPLLHLIYNH